MKTIQFTDTSTGSPDGWLWDFGDGTTSTEQNPEHTYSESGDFVVKLIVSRDDIKTGASTSEAVVEVPDAPPPAGGPWVTYTSTAENMVYFNEYVADIGSVSALDDGISPNKTDATTIAYVDDGVDITGDAEESSLGVIGDYYYNDNELSDFYVFEGRINAGLFVDAPAPMVAFGWIGEDEESFDPYDAPGNTAAVYYSDGSILELGSLSTGYPTFTTGDIIAAAMNVSREVVYFYKNGEYIGEANTQGFYGHTHVFIST